VSDTPSIDFTSRDFTSIRQDILSRASITVPEWTTRDPTDFGVLLVELVAYVGDTLSYYLDRSAYEAFLATAVRRESVLYIADMLDYRPTPRAPATVSMTFNRAAGGSGVVTVPAGTVISTSTAGGDAAVKFQTDVVMSIPSIANSGTVLATEGLTKSDELLGTSIGMSNMQYLLQYIGVYESTVRLFVAEGALGVDNIPDLVEWKQVDRLITEDATGSVFSVRTGADGSTYIVLGDGVHGRIPPTNTQLFATYRYGVGGAGNVGPGALTVLDESVEGVGNVTNTAAASGAADAESIESMRISIPTSLGAQDRAVTVMDYRALALKVNGVVKANSNWTTGTSVNVAIAPNTPTAPSTALKAEVEAYIEARAIAGWSVNVSNPSYVPIKVTITLNVLPQYVQSWVVADVLAAVTDLLAYDKQDFAQRFRLGDVYRVILDVEGVDYAVITVLDINAGTGLADRQGAWNEIFVPGAMTITPTGGITG
jgi:uncharacterized phage protein gp47/JayE